MAMESGTASPLTLLRMFQRTISSIRFLDIRFLDIRTHHYPMDILTCLPRMDALTQCRHMECPVIIIQMRSSQTIRFTMHRGRDAYINAYSLEV